MSLQEQIRNYLEATGTSKRALSMFAGLDPKVVSDILNIPGLRPTRKTLDALGSAMGVTLDQAPESITFGTLLARLGVTTGDAEHDRRNATRLSRVKALLRVSGWPTTTVVDRRQVVDFFAGATAATFDLTEGSYSTYKSDILSAMPTAATRNRKPGIRDVGGFYRDLYDRVKASTDLPKDMKFVSGTFFAFLDQEGFLPSEVSTSVLDAYFHHRIEVSGKSEAACRKHVKRIACLVGRLASDPNFSSVGFCAAEHPFEALNDKYGVPETEFAALLDEFDGPVSGWLRGKESRDGSSYEEFLERLDAMVPPKATEGKKTLLKRKDRRKLTDDERRSAGFLLVDEQWSETTLSKRRSLLVAGAKALFAATGYHIESIEEYTDPDVVEAVLEAVDAANSGKEFPSSYVSTMGKALKKFARDYIARSAEDISAISELIKAYTYGKKGIAERNKAKLRKLVGDRQQRVIDLGDILVEQVNAALEKEHAKSTPRKKRLDCLDTEMVRDIMCAVTSDILLARAPRSANVTDIKLDWISWMGGRARITIPASEVKLRDGDDPDLPIPLGDHASARLRTYIDKIRAKALRRGDTDNPYLFPSQGGPDLGTSYTGLLERLMRHTHRVVGVRMNPHLYRHFLGWIWLKEDPDRLPDVQRLLGHKSLETTLQYYAEIDEELALDRWQGFLEGRKSRRSKPFARKPA